MKPGLQHRNLWIFALVQRRSGLEELVRLLSDSGLYSETRIFSAMYASGLTSLFVLRPRFRRPSA